MSRLCYDFETDGLFADTIRPGTKNPNIITRVHCLVTQDVDTGEVRRYHEDPTLPREGPLREGVATLLAADMRCGQNVLDYDERVTREFYPDLWAARNRAARVWDTVVGAAVVFPREHLKGLDAGRCRIPGSTFPKNLMGSHKLEAWGHRLGIRKGGYGGDFKTFTADMLTYCVQDVAVTVAFFKHLEEWSRRGFLSSRAWNLEQRFKEIVGAQERTGFPFDSVEAEKLQAELQGRRAEIRDRLVVLFPPEVEEYETPKRKIRKTRIVPFNPNSPIQIGRILRERHGWKPTEWTPTGHPQVTNATLEGVDLPGVPELLEYFTVNTRLEQLAEGPAAWMKAVKGDGRIHGRCDHNAAVTHRCAHSSPPVVGVPKVGKPYGKQCRSLFGPPPGRILVGVDASGLELRALAHYLHPVDGGAYVQAATTDPHEANRVAFGIPDGPLGKDTAKRAIYCLLYGGGDAKLGRTMGLPKAAAKVARALFDKNTKGFLRLKRDVMTEVARTKSLGLPDGRRTWVRSAHSAINSLLQATGAIVMKVAIVRMHDRFRELGLDVLQHHVAHDEVQLSAPPEQAEQVMAEATDAIRWAGERLGLRCPMNGKGKIGASWAKTH